MSYHLIIGDKLYSSWSLRGALALELAGVPYEETLIKLNQPDTRKRILEFSASGKVPLLKTEHGVIADSLAIAEYLAERHPDAQLWPADVTARAQARSACAQMHSGFMALRSAMPFDLSRDEALESIPLDVQVDIDRMVALWSECRLAAKDSGPFLFGKPSLADAFFAPVAVRCVPTASKCPRKRPPTSRPSTSGRPSRSGRRQAWRSVKGEADSCGSSSHSWYRWAHPDRSARRHPAPGGLWEFPGGKVEEGEAVEAALARELREELGIEVTRSRPLIKVSHDYPDKQVLLDVREVDGFTGEPHGAEGQPLAWVAPRDLGQYDFPEANTPIVAAARLPDQYLITPDGLDAPQLLRGIQKAIANGIRLIQLRAPDMYDPQVSRRGGGCGRPVCRQGPADAQGTLGVVGGFPFRRLAPDLGTAAQVCCQWPPLPQARWLAASCHDAEELALAEQMGVDFVTLSPVQATQTHPDARRWGGSRRVG